MVVETAVMAFAPMDHVARPLGGVALPASIAPVMKPLEAMGVMTVLAAGRMASPSLGPVGTETRVMAFAPMEHVARPLVGVVLPPNIAPVIALLVVGVTVLEAVAARKAEEGVATPLLVPAGAETMAMVFA